MSIPSLKHGSIYFFVVALSVLFTCFYMFNLETFSRYKCNQISRLPTGFDSADLHCQDENRASVCVFLDQRMTTRDHILLRNILEKCVSVLEAIDGLDYFIHQTSLIGFSRHNKDFIPWDDTVHLAVVVGNGESKFARVVSTIGRVAGEIFGNDYSTQFNNNTKTLKFFGKTVENSKQIRSDDPMIFWRWPYVQIQMMIQDGRKIYAPWLNLTYDVADVLPTKFDSLAGVEVRVPANYQKILKQIARHLDLCQSRDYDTKSETEIDKVEMFKCRDLKILAQLKVNETNETFAKPKCELGKQLDDPWLCFFMPVLSIDEKQVLLELFSLAIDMLEELPKSSYFIYSGSLLGYWRHGQKMIPWDDDSK